MTTLTIAPTPLQDTRVFRLAADTWRGSPLLTGHAIALLVGFAVCLGLPFFDDRLFNGINVWHKPAKFFFSLAVQLATVAWALSLVDPSIRIRRIVRWPAIAMVVAAWLEMGYIVFRAARAEGSHYNVDQPLEQVLYSLMGLGAVTLTSTAALVGLVIWRDRGGDIWKESAGLGLMLGNVLATIVAIPLASGTGHWIGGDQTDATGLPLFFWSTTGGDLRIAHFVALHIMQALPFAALSGRRSVVYGVALAMMALTVAVFAQAMMGVPLFRP